MKARLPIVLKPNFSSHSARKITKEKSCFNNDKLNLSIEIEEDTERIFVETESQTGYIIYNKQNQWMTRNRLTFKEDKEKLRVNIHIK